MSDFLGALRETNVLNSIANPTVVNPLAAMSSAMQTARGVYDVRQQQANQAVGQAYQGAIDAQGNLDPQRFRQNLAQAGPVAAMAAGEGLQNIQNIGSNQYQMDVSRRNIVNGIAVSALGITDPQQQQDYLSRQGGLLIRNGIMPPEQVLNAFGAMPTDPAARRQYLEGIRVQTLPPDQQQGAIYGTPLEPITGPGGGITQPVRGTPAQGYGLSTAPGSVAQGLTPAQSSQLDTVNMPDGTTLQMPHGTATVLLQNETMRRLNPQLVTGGGGGAAASPNANINQGFGPNAGRNQPPATSPLPGIGSTAPPGQVESQRTAAEGATGRGSQLIQQQQAATSIKPILAGMDQDLTAMGDSGTSSKTLGTLRQVLLRWGLTPEQADVSSPQAAQEQFVKFASQLQAAQLGQIGGIPTDNRQELTQASNPSLVLSTAGNRGIIHVLQGNQDAIETMGNSWVNSDDYKRNPGSFDTWRSQFTTKDNATGGQFDPRVFWFNRMTGDEQKAYAQNMAKNHPQEWKQFNYNWNLAKQNGWVTPIGQQ